MNNDQDLQEEDLDAFLVLLESRLRADFTSPDLSRIISSQGTSISSSSSSSSAVAASTTTSSSSAARTTTLPSGNASNPSKFLRLIHQVFKKAGKPVKLRSLLSVLGLDSDEIVVLLPPEFFRTKDIIILYRCVPRPVSIIIFFS